MKYNFKIEGLDCTNCALELERKIKKIEGVEDARINFFMGRMELVLKNNKEEIIKMVKKTIKKIEPDVEVKEI